MIKSSSRVAVLDLTHGGAVIARKLKGLAGSVTAIDVYRTLSREALAGLEDEGIGTSQDAVGADEFDVLVAPVHLDPNYPMLIRAVNSNIPVLTHHAAVGQILSNYNLKEKTIIEVTGTKAKTSTAVLLAMLLSRDKRVISHTSMGIEDWGTGATVRKGLSITPASILTAIDTVKDAGIEPDVFIFEVSLGGTGCADAGIITTIAGDYPIASGTRMASEAKRQMVLNAKPGSTLVVNYEALRAFGACRRDTNVISFSDAINAASNVYYESTGSKGTKIAYYLGSRQGGINIREAPDYDINSYQTAFACAAAAALAMGADSNTIESAISEFRGAQGRMRKANHEGRTLIDDSNSGMDIRSAWRALSYAKAEGGRIVMVLGEEAQQVCEGLEPSAVRSFIGKHLDELEALVLVGKRMQPIIQDNTSNNIYYADDLLGGIELATRLTQEKDIILSCVKCFR